MTRDTAEKYSQVAIVVAMYREEAIIQEVVNDLKATFPLVICVDDGSDDSSAIQAGKAGAEVICHPFNLGQGAALQTGIEAALNHPDVQYIVTFDADGQHLASDAELMVNKLMQTGNDVVFGSRFLDGRTELQRAKRLVLKCAILYTNALSGMKLTDAHNGLRAFKRNVAQSIHLTHDGMAHATEIVNQIGKAGFSFCEMPVHIKYTDYSKAKGQSLWNSINILFDLIFK